MTSAIDSGSGWPPAGLHRIRSRRSSRALCRSLGAAGMRCFLVDFRRAVDKPTLLRAIAEAIGAPASAGRNWDAFEEALRDLRWAPAGGYALIVTGARGMIAGDPASWLTLLQILASGVAHWQTRGIPLAVLIRGAPAGRSPAEIPEAGGS